MHEWSLAHEILRAVFAEPASEEDADIEINRIHVKLSSKVLGHCDGASLQFCLGEIARGTIAEDAEMAVEVLPLRRTCRRCKMTFQTEQGPIACPACGSADMESASADESQIEITCTESVGCPVRRSGPDLSGNVTP